MITKEKTRDADEMLHMRIQAWHEKKDREIQRVPSVRSYCRKQVNPHGKTAKHENLSACLTRDGNCETIRFSLAS